MGCGSSKGTDVTDSAKTPTPQPKPAQNTTASSEQTKPATIKQDETATKPEVRETAVAEEPTSEPAPTVAAAAEPAAASPPQPENPQSESEEKKEPEPEPEPEVEKESQPESEKETEVQAEPEKETEKEPEPEKETEAQPEEEPETEQKTEEATPETEQKTDEATQEEQSETEETTPESEQKTEEATREEEPKTEETAPETEQKPGEATPEAEAKTEEAPPEAQPEEATEPAQETEAEAKSDEIPAQEPVAECGHDLLEVPVIDPPAEDIPEPSNQEDFNEFEKATLKSHNECRAKHGVPEMSLKKELCRAAQEYAELIAGSENIVRSPEESRTMDGAPVGESVINGPETLTGEEATLMLYEEIDHYNFEKHGYSDETGRFTQLVWSESLHLGVGKATSPDGTQTVVVCRYFPSGNTEGGFEENVKLVL